MKDTIFFWFNHPPKVGKGAFNFVANNWPGRVYYVFLNDFREERKKANWNDGDFGNAKIIELFNSKNIKLTISQLLEQNPNSIHIVNGLNSPITKLLLPIIKNKGENKVIYMTERPDQIGGVMERSIRECYFYLKYHLLSRKLFSLNSGILALGKIGVTLFEKYGFPKDKLFQFMYCPAAKDLKNNEEYHVPEAGETLKFLYVGRFYNKTKGTDILINATKRLKGNFLVDFVGGYGKDSETIKKEISSKDYLHYLGTWAADEVGLKMQSYDAVVIPSRYDGWNLLVNEAVNAGIPVVVTDGAVSDEVISNFECGIVVKHSSVTALAAGMQKIIDNPSLLRKFRKNILKAKEAINENRVGQYLIDIINHTIYADIPRPSCPW